MKHKPRHAAPESYPGMSRRKFIGGILGTGAVLALTFHQTTAVEDGYTIKAEASPKKPTPIPELAPTPVQKPTPQELKVEDLPPLSPELQRIQDIQDLISSVDDDYLKKHEGLEGRFLRIKYRSAFVDELSDGRTRLTLYVDSAEPGNPDNEAEFYDFALKSPRETECDPVIAAAKRRVKKTLRQTLGITVGHDEPGEMHIDRVIISGGQTNCLSDDHPLKSDRPTV